MRLRFILTIMLTVLSATFAAADNTVWHIHASYHNPTKAVKVGDLAFVLANGDLYSYDQDGAVETYDKTNALSDFGIYDIAYCKGAKTLVILYDNCNVDLLTTEGDTWNMPELKDKTLLDKTLHHLEVHGKNAYVSFGKSLSVINCEKQYFAGTYTFSEEVKFTQVTDSQICVTTTSKHILGNVKDNLLDPNNWNEISETTYKATPFATLPYGNTGDAEALTKAGNYTINSPIRNLSYRMRFEDTGRLLIAGGKVSDHQLISEPATGLFYEDGKWSYLDDSEIIGKETPKSWYIAATDLIQDPKDASHHYLSTFGTGLYEFRDKKFTKHHTYGNSELMSILPNNTYNKNYVRISALGFDPKGNLWMANNQVDTIIKILTPEGNWKRIYNNRITGFPTLDKTYFDLRGWAWIINRRSTNSTGASGILLLDATKIPETTPSANAGKYLSSFYNQDGSSYSPDRWYCLQEDLEGYMWFGNTSGLFVSYEPANAFDSDFTLTQIKINREDGSGYADYLLNGVAVKCIAIDGANRKWIGSLNNGVYLISADGQVMLQHFTTANSPLIDNVINDIQISPTTGEIFIATDKGLCSYRDQTLPTNELSSSNIKVYPNPLRPEMEKKITITGLALNTTVKIANAAGRLVRQGTSTSGAFTWNCRTDDDKLVPGGIYYVLATDSEGKRGATAKLLIIR